MLNDAVEMFSDSAEHLFVIYMLFVILQYLCNFIHLITLYAILHITRINVFYQKLYLFT